MKFVRIEDGRIIDFSGATSVQIHAFKSHYKFVKQADSIDDLCDNFVVEYTSGEHTTFHYFCDLHRHYELYSQDYHHVAGRYGAIWITGKGLIYVAEMNKKGELELISFDENQLKEKTI